MGGRREGNLLVLEVLLLAQGSTLLDCPPAALQCMFMLLRLPPRRPTIPSSLPTPVGEVTPSSGGNFALMLHSD